MARQIHFKGEKVSGEELAALKFAIRGYLQL
jgi:hypothetical protein